MKCLEWFPYHSPKESFKVILCAEGDLEFAGSFVEAYKNTLHDNLLMDISEFFSSNVTFCLASQNDKGFQTRRNKLECFVGHVMRQACVTVFPFFLLLSESLWSFGGLLWFQGRRPDGVSSNFLGVPVPKWGPLQASIIFFCHVDFLSDSFVTLPGCSTPDECFFFDNGLTTKSQIKLLSYEMIGGLFGSWMSHSKFVSERPRQELRCDGVAAITRDPLSSLAFEHKGIDLHVEIWTEKLSCCFPLPSEHPSELKGVQKARRGRDECFNGKAEGRPPQKNEQGLSMPKRNYGA